MNRVDLEIEIERRARLGRFLKIQGSIVGAMLAAKSLIPFVIV